MNDPYKAEFGQWWEFENPLIRCLCFDVSTEGRPRFISRGGLTWQAHDLKIRKCRHLPNCTGWDWQPESLPDPGEGWRLLRDDEVTVKFDEWLNNDGEWNPTCVNGVLAGKLIASSFGGIRAYRRRIAPTHRPAIYPITGWRITTGLDLQVDTHSILEVQPCTPS